VTVYTVYLRTDSGRAPQYVCLDKEYRRAGSVSVHHKSAVSRVVAERKRRGTDSYEIRVGDVIVSASGEAWIYTATGSWASVKEVEY